jgi:putative flavoprotein involved in K+ transport
VTAPADASRPSGSGRSGIDGTPARTAAVVVGAGHAGLSTSYYLKAHDVEHVVLERGRVGETWRSQRWDSFTLVTPNWMNRLPDFHYDGDDPDGFLLLHEVHAYLDGFAERNALPIRTGITVQSVEQAPDGSTFLVHTDAETIRADAVVVAAGSFQIPRVPDWSRQLAAPILQIAATEYRNPAALPDGAVLVVGSGQTGGQIAEELAAAGRKVFLSVGSAGRILRTYRGKDSSWWLTRVDPWTPEMTPPRLLMPVEMLPNPAWRFAPNPHSSGKDGGHTINLHRLARDGMTLTGHAVGAEDGVLVFADNLRENLTKADQFAAGFCAGIDRWVSEHGWDIPPPDETNTDEYYGLDGFDQEPPLRLDPMAAGIATVVWAGGFTHDFSWVKPAPLDEFAYPVHKRGVTSVPGLYFAGLHFLTNPTSDLFYGIAEDSAYVASHLAAALREPTTA